MNNNQNTEDRLTYAKERYHYLSKQRKSNNPIEARLSHKCLRSEAWRIRALTQYQQCQR